MILRLNFLILGLFFQFGTSHAQFAVGMSVGFEVSESVKRQKFCESLRFSCKEEPQWLLPLKASCEADKKTFQCEETFKDNPELKPKLRDCSPFGVCRHYHDPIGVVKGCFKGAKDSWFEFLKSIEKKNNFIRDCDKDLNCKRLLAQLTLTHRNATGEQLEKLSASYLWVQMQNNEAMAAQIARNSQGSKFLSEKAEQAQKEERERGLLLYHSDSLKSRAEDLYLAAEDILKQAGIKVECFNSEARSEMICFGVGMIVDPTMVAGFAYGAVKSPKLLKYLKEKMTAKRPPEKAQPVAESRKPPVEGERRDPEFASTPVTKNDPRTPQRAAYNSEYLNKKSTTPAQNRKFMDSETANGKNGLYASFENAFMKLLNDKILLDKNLVTSLTNHHREILLKKISELQAKYPDLEILPYSDFKSTRLAFNGKIPPNLQADLEKMFKESNEQFLDEVRKAGVLRKDDKPDEWFRAALCRNPDGCDRAIEVGKNDPSNNRMRSDSEPEVVEAVQKSFADTEALRKQLQDSLHHTPLMEPVSGTGRMTPTGEVLDLAKKSKDPESLAASLNERFGRKDITREQADLLRNYDSGINSFSPSLRIEKREIVNLENAVDGGYSADFRGLGASNRRATAQALARARNPDEAATLAREGERAVTAEMARKLEAFKKQAHAEGSPFCSGDDCNNLALWALSKKDRQKTLDRINADPDTRKLRLSFISENIKKPADRQILGTHGETIEKSLREVIKGIPPEKLDNITFGIDMRSTAAHSGEVGLLISDSSAKLTWRERRRIEKAFKEAIREANEKIKKSTGKDTNYFVGD